SKKTAVAIEQAMRQTGLSSVGIRDDRDFRVLVRTKMPAVLVECGYLTNPTEAAMLFKSDFQDRVARAIAEGIIASL
ncbi:MAG: N-acetylmuramoyl-L-alanine amidase family protein, partial [Planctomycetota bacterium]